MKLKKYKLRKLCLPNQIGKYGIPAPAIAYSNGKIRYLRISDISEEGTLVNTDKKSVESDDIEQYILEENDIVFARTGNSTGRAYLYDKRDGVMAYAGFLIKYQLDEHKVNPIYLRYFTLSTFYKQWVANLSVGSTRGNISAQTFADCPIVLPPRHQQDVLVETLSNIDAKIKLNRQINDNLEAMAKQLYDYWFVQFDFPNEEGKPYKSSGGAMVWNEKLKREIPEGWKVANVFDELSVQYGFPFSTELFTEEPTNIPVVRIRDILENSVSAYSEEEVDEKYKLQKQDLLVGMDGNFHMNYWNDNVSYLNQRSVRLRAKSKSAVSIMQAKYDIAPYIKAKELRAKGSTVGHLSDKDLKELFVLVSPNVDFRNKFNSILAEIIENRCEMIELTKQRDELLPLLMNGQASVNYHLSVLFLSPFILYRDQYNFMT